MMYTSYITCLQAVRSQCVSPTETVVIGFGTSNSRHPYDDGMKTMRSRPKPLAACLVAFGWAAVLATLLAGCDRGGDDPADPVVINVLVAYSPSVAAGAGDVDAFVQGALHETNVAYANSNVDIRLELAHLMPVDYEATERLQDLERLIRIDDGYLDDIHAMRDEHEADVGALLLDERSSTINGAVLADEATAFVIIYGESLGAPSYALAHEVGHLHGARHSPETDPRTEPFPYGHGFRNDSVKTIMSTGQLEVLPYFSGPDLTYEGVVLGDSTQRNVARVLRETAVYVANFRGPQMETDFVPPGTWPTIDLEE